MHKPTTLKDIALKLNLSASSVSKALRNCPDIGETTRRRVNNYAKKIGYQCNPMGSNLRTKRTNLIGIIVPDITDPFNAQIVAAATSAIAKRGYNVIIRQSKGDDVEEKRTIQELANGWVDGLIVLTPFTNNYLTSIKMLQPNLPIVILNDNSYPIYISDSETNCELASYTTETLIRMGHKKINYLGQTQKKLGSCHFVIRYKAALARHKIPFEENYITLLAHQFDYFKGKSLIENVENTLNNDGAFLITGKQIIIFILKNIPNLKINISAIKIQFFSDSLLCLHREVKGEMLIKKSELGYTATQNLIKMIETGRRDLNNKQFV